LRAAPPDVRASGIRYLLRKRLSAVSSGGRDPSKASRPRRLGLRPTGFAYAWALRSWRPGATREHSAATTLASVVSMQARFRFPKRNEALAWGRGMSPSGRFLTYRLRHRRAGSRRSVGGFSRYRLSTGIIRGLAASLKTPSFAAESRRAEC
jgi:hypothetical protein